MFGYKFSFAEDILTVKRLGFPTYSFRIVEEVPKGYSIWNIGKESMPKGYLPLCKMCSHKSFGKNDIVDTNELLAVKLDGAEHLLDVAVFGVKDLQDVKYYIKRYGNEPERTWKKRVATEMINALPVMREFEKMCAN